jgi:uncharacterized lipoprotein YajG
LVAEIRNTNSVALKDKDVLRRKNMNMKIWFLVLSTAALFFAGCAAQMQQNEMARARALANGDEALAAQYYMQMEAGRQAAILQMMQNANNHVYVPQNIPPVNVPQLQQPPVVQVYQPAPWVPIPPTVIPTWH